MSTQKTTKVKFIKEKETSNTVRFKEVPEEGQAPVMNSLYIQKWYAGEAKGVEIAITIGA